jgi:divalent metal cation (Fe/Co/Zn/Cd) transporter
MVRFLKNVVSFSIRFAVLLGALVAFAVGVEALSSGMQAAINPAFLSRVWIAVLASLFAVVPAIFLFAIHRTLTERRPQPSRTGE